MRKFLLASAALAALVLPAKADIVASATFTSDHCTGGCGPQTGGFGTITGTDHQNGVIDISITLNNNNVFANGGQQVGFGFNLDPNISITYSNLNTALWTVVGGFGAGNLQQNAGALTADGFGIFEYGVDGLFNGGQGPSSLSFTITGAGLSLASFAQLSTNPPGDTQAFFGIDILSGTTGFTGFVDCCAGQPTPFSVPGPIVGAGLPGLIAACGMMLGLARHRRRRA